MPLKAVLLSAVLLHTASARAHGTTAEGETSWPDLAVGLILAGVWLTYMIGSRRARPKDRQYWLFHGTSLITALTAFAPWEVWTGNGAALHMTQHMLILVLIAPLFVLARPLPQWLAAVGRHAARLWKPLLRMGRSPLATCCLQGVLIWFWHAPRFYNLALTDPWWHLIEHVCFALSAALFWWSVLDKPGGASLFSLLFTLIHTGMLGAVLTFAQKPLYGDLKHLQDQQLAGLIMWIPASLPYLIASCWCCLHYFRKNRLHPVLASSRYLR